METKTATVGTVFNRTASYLVANGRVVASAPLGENAKLFRIAKCRNIQLVNAESLKGLAVLDELHSHAKSFPASPKRD